METSTAPSPAHLLLMGLPESGKTSFVAALWHLIRQTSVPCPLQLVRVQDEAKYLYDIEKQWLNFQPMPHTETRTIEPILLVLQDQNGQTMEIAFPDVNGETFRTLWADRVWGEAIAPRVVEADGLLVFIHPSQAERPRAHVETNSLLTKLGNGRGPSPVKAPTTEKIEKIIPYDPQMAATQAQIVDWLQNFRIMQPTRPANQPLRVGLIISAWDLAEKAMEESREWLPPKVWLSRKFPLLWQFVRANRAWLEFQVWGLSAYGGDVANDKDLKRLQRETRPAKRIVVVEGDAVKDQTSHDITSPLRWATQAAQMKVDGQ